MWLSRQIVPFIASWPSASLYPWVFSIFLRTADPSTPAGTLMTVRPLFGRTGKSSRPIAATAARQAAAILAWRAHRFSMPSARIRLRLSRWALMSVLAGVNGVSLSRIAFLYRRRSR